MNESLPTSHQSHLTVLIALGLLALCSIVQAVVPAPDGGYPGFNTAEGQNALKNLTTGAGNTGVGWYSLFSDITGSFNTGVGAGTLALNNADSNTAVGAAALLLNTDGTENTAVGTRALLYNDTGAFNTAIGSSALSNNTEGSSNTATGRDALLSNTTGNDNTAIGRSALGSNATGSRNTAIGFRALASNFSGVLNNAVGGNALFNTTVGTSNNAFGDDAMFDNVMGSLNTAIGDGAGYAITGSGNVCIGASVFGIAGENDHTYIRNINTTSVSGGGSDFVTVDLATGLLGHATSSRRYKEEIKPMEDASEALFALKPVTFRYKKEIDQGQSLQYGLVAEEVAQVDQNLAIRDGKGQIENVRYSAINAMLLNEFLKAHRKIETLEATVAQQRKGMEVLTAQLQEQAAQIQKVTTQVDATKPLPHLVLNNP